VYGQIRSLIIGFNREKPVDRAGMLARVAVIFIIRGEIISKRVKEGETSQSISPVKIK
jgi:hypothetical protein